MQKNQARSNQQRCVASSIVLHARRADRLLLANADVLPIRRFSFGGEEFTDVIQFIP